MSTPRSPRAAMRIRFIPGFTRINPYQEHLAAALRRRGLEVHIADDAGPGDPPDVLHIHWTHPFIRPRLRPRALRRAVNFARALTRFRRAGTRIVWTVHNLHGHAARLPALEARQHRWLFGRCDRVIVHCEAARGLVKDAFGLQDDAIQRIHVVQHPHYMDAYPEGIGKREARDRLGLPADGHIALMLGRIQPYKRPDALIRAFRHMPERDWHLLLAGPVSPRYLAVLRRAAGNDGRIVLAPGFVPDEDVQTYFAACDVAVLPFQDVLTSGSAVLAMGFGRAVVAPRIGCIASLLAHQDALLYDPNLPGGLERALERAKGMDLDVLGAANRRHAAGQDWDNAAEATEAVYRS